MPRRTTPFQAKAARAPDAALLRAARQGDVGGIKLAFADGARPSADDAIGNSLMGVLPGGTRRPATDLLIAKGVDPNYLSKEGQTPLMLAIVRDDRRLARTLLRLGANPNFENRHHETALSFAIVWGRFELAASLLAHGARVDHPRKPWTPLMYAAQEGNARLVRKLLRAGASRTLKDQHGRTPEDIARDRGHTRLASLLRKRPQVTAATPRTKKEVTEARPKKLTRGQS